MFEQAIDSISRRSFAVHSGAGLAGLAAVAVSGGGTAAAADDQIQPVGGRSQSDPGSGEGIPLAPPDKQPAKLKLPSVPNRKIGYAIVGLGKLAVDEILPAFAKCKVSQPVALVSGHADKANQIADVYNISRDSIYNYDSYDQLADNDEVDVIYIVLPNSMHAEYTVRGFAAGKHVLCEKPMASSISECEQMIAAGEKADRQLMIAYRLHYEPFNQMVMKICNQKSLGAIKTFSGSFCINVEAPNIRLSKKLAGGPVGDVGVYPLNAARYVAGEEPSHVSAIAHQPTDDPRFGEVPESVSCVMKFPSGILASWDCSFGTNRSDFYRVACSDGTIELSPAFSYTGQQLRTDEPGQNGPAKIIQHDITPANHFAAEMDDFSQCIINGKSTRTPGQEGLADMRVMAAMDRSMKTGKLEKV